MINFTVGPVQEFDYTREIAAERTPYFRNEYFSNIMLDNEQMIKELAKAPKQARALFLTCSGTGGMEAAIINSFTRDDKLLIVNGGSFGKRLVNICTIYDIPYDEIRLAAFEVLTEEHLKPYEQKEYTGLLINMNETSMGKLYDMEMVSSFCKRNHLFLVVDAISAFLADPIDMRKWEIDVLIISSQKALALPPGISTLILSEKAVHRVLNNNPVCFYLDLKDALVNAERGQTPFTPAVATLVQMHERLKRLVETGVEAETERIRQLAEQFRNGIADLPVRIPSPSLSNAVTPIWLEQGNAGELAFKLENEFDIWICPNGGEMKDHLFRVGHIGDLTSEDNDRLLCALRECLL